MVDALGIVLTWALAQSDVPPAAPPEAAAPAAPPPIPEDAHVSRPPGILDPFEPLAKARQQWADGGFQFSLNLTIDGGYNFTGGNQAGGYVAGLLTATIAIDTERLAKWKGGTFVTTWQSYYETNPGPFNLIPDWWGYDGIATGFGDINQVSECYYRQTLLDDALTVIFGKQDACNNFLMPLGSDNGFVNTMTMYPAGMMPYVPSYPDQAMGLVITGRPTDWLDLKLGWFDGTTAYSPNGEFPHSTGSLGPGTFFDNPGSWFFIGEAETSWSLGEGLGGSFGVGGWWQTGPSVGMGFNMMDPMMVSDGVGGYYIQGAQRIYNPEPSSATAQGLQVFGQFGWQKPSANPVHWSMLGGLQYTGLIPGRANDTVGLGVGYASFSDSGMAYRGVPNLYELAIEAYYRIAITPWMTLQPDLQVVSTPIGDAQAPTAVIGILRLSINF